MSPIIEKLDSKGYKVLFATQPLDEIMFDSLREYKEFNVVDAAKDNLQLDDDTAESQKQKGEAERGILGND